MHGGLVAPPGPAGCGRTQERDRPPPTRAVSVTPAGRGWSSDSRSGGALSTATRMPALTPSSRPLACPSRWTPAARPAPQSAGRSLASAAPTRGHAVYVASGKSALMPRTFAGRHRRTQSECVASSSSCEGTTRFSTPRATRQSREVDHDCVPAPLPRMARRSAEPSSFSKTTSWPSDVSRRRHSRPSGPFQ